MMSEEESRLDVNDVFDELIEENERLNIELIFAKSLLDVLIEMKKHLMNKIKHPDNSEYTVLMKSDMTKFINLDKQFNIICKKRFVVINEEVFESVEQNSVETVNEQISTDLVNFEEEVEQRQVNDRTSTENLDSNKEVEQRYVDQLIEGIDQINIMTKENEEEDKEEVSYNHQDQQETFSDKLDEQLFILQISENDQVPSVDSELSNSNCELLFKKRELIEIYEKSDDGKLIKKIKFYVDDDNFHNLGLFPVTEECDLRLSYDPNIENESIECHPNNDMTCINEVVNEVGVQTENECDNAIIIDDNVGFHDNKNSNTSEVITDANPKIVERRVCIDLDQSTPSERSSCDETDEEDGRVIIIEDNDYSDESNKSEQVINVEKINITEEQLDTNQLDEPQDRAEPIEIMCEPSTSKTIYYEPEECEINQARRSSRIRLKELVMRGYVLRQSPRSKPIDYNEETCIINHDSDEEDDIRPTTTLKRPPLSIAVPKPNESGNMDKKTTKYFVCDFDGCGKKLKTRVGLDSHRQSHHHDNRNQVDQKLLFRCKNKNCYKIFTTKDESDRHQQDNHQDLVIIRCQVCFKEFDNRAELKRHFSTHIQTNNSFNNVSPGLQSEITKQLKFECDICAKSFSTRKDMTRHLNKHTDRFKCRVLGCNYRGDRAYDLKKHVINKHSN